MPNTDVMLITKKNFPALYKAFETISHDAGAQAGHTNYAISLTWKTSGLRKIENKLANLLQNADSDFECLCIGEESERAAIVESYKLELVDKLLQEFYEEL